MANCASATGTRSDAAASSPALCVDDLFRLLIAEITAQQAHPAAIDAEEIIVDRELDGARYLLVRMPVTSHARAMLSPREHEIVRMVAQGHPNKVIADVLSISSWTVGTHLRCIFAKLGVGSRAAMIARLGAVDHSSDLEGATSKKRLTR